MTDHIRRLLGMTGGEARSRPDSEPQGDQKPRTPELSPGEVRVGRESSVSAVALRVTLVIVGVLLMLVLLYQLRELVLVFVVALIVAAGMHDAAAAIERRGAPRTLSVVLAYLGLVAAIALLVVLIAGPLVSEIDRLVENAPQVLADARQQAVQLIDRLGGDGAGDRLMQGFQNALGAIELGGLLELPLQAAGVIVNIILILFLSAFLVRERDRAARSLTPFIAPEKREPTLALGRAVFRRLGRFVQGQLLVMSVVGAAMFAGLIVLGIPFALPLSLFAFLAEAIPMIGPWIAIVPAAAVAFAESPAQAAILLGWWFVVQQVEGYLLTPAVMGRVQHVSPTVVLLSVLAGFELFGIVGALIAVPVVAALAMVIESVVRPAREESFGEAPKAAADSG